MEDNKHNPSTNKSNVFPPKKQLPDKKRTKQLMKKVKKLSPEKAENVERYSPDLLIGLTKDQVEKRFEDGLTNLTNKKYSKSILNIFIGNIFTFFNFLCIFAMCALIYSGAGLTNYLFVLIFVANMIIGIVQEIRAKLQIDKLSILAVSNIKVKRYGTLLEIPVGEVVLDDVIYLEMGDQVPADCIVGDGIIEVNESLLTGESESIKKKQGDPIYAGSFISSGSCRARVEKVGKETYISSLTSQAKKYKKPNSEIMNSISKFVRIIGILIVPICIAMFWTNWTNTGAQADSSFSLFAIETWFGEAVKDSARYYLNITIQKTCAVIVGMIPSGMMLLTSVALAVGVMRLAKKNTLVQDLYSLEMLARVDTLCLDKTGTITDGRMRVNDYKLLNNPVFRNGSFPYKIEDVVSSMLAALPDNNQTSIALFNKFGHSTTLHADGILPFSSKRKYSAVYFDGVGTFAMGAPEFVFPKAPKYLETLVKEYAIKGLRVLVLGFSAEKLKDETIPENMTPYALISIQDNIREDAITSIKWFKENGVDVKVISGDNAVTVSEVARRAGVEHAEKYISLEGLTDAEVAEVADDYSVFGRVTPEQKQILVRALKLSGHTVAMTGDGVNDLLALKEADCAISVASGSEAARNVSHLVLMDNNFNSMPEIVFEGRRVINNIENTASLYLMKTILVAFLAIFCLIVQTPYFFQPKNMMLFEMFVSGLPSFFLSLQPNSKKVEGKFFWYVISHSIPQALTMFLSIMIIYLSYSIPSFGGSIYSADPETAKLEWNALMVIILTASGIVMLCNICQPFNVLRGSLFAFVLGICLLAVTIRYGNFALGDLFIDDYHLVYFNAAEILLISTTVLLAFPISKYCTKFCEWLSKSKKEDSGKEKVKKA